MVKRKVPGLTLVFICTMQSSSKQQLLASRLSGYVQTASLPVSDFRNSGSRLEAAAVPDAAGGKRAVGEEGQEGGRGEAEDSVCSVLLAATHQEPSQLHPRSCSADGEGWAGLSSVTVPVS